MPEPCLWLLANSRPARSWSNPPPSAAGGLLLTGVCRPVTGVMRWDARPDGLDEEAGGRGFTLDATVTGVGSGVTGDRATLGKVLAGPRVGGVVVEHRDRFARFGVEHLVAALAVTGRR